MRQERAELLVRLLLSQPIAAAGEQRRHERVEDLGAALRVDISDTASRRHFGRREDVAVPQLSLRIALSHEQKLFPGSRAGNEDQNALFLRNTGEVQEVALLAVLVVGVARIHARRRAPHHEHGFGTERGHRLRAAGGQIGRVLTSAAERRHLAGDRIKPPDREGDRDHQHQQERSSHQVPREPNDGIVAKLGGGGQTPSSGPAGTSRIAHRH